jgi:hypothetical protein
MSSFGATGHPSPLHLERFSVGELAEPTRAATAEHVRACVACAALLDELARAKEARLAAVPPARFVAEVAARVGRRGGLALRRRVTVVGGALAAAAALFLLVARPRPDVRLRGAGLAVQRQRDGVVQVLASADTVRAGDSLRVVVTLARPARVAAWFLDARGRVDGLTPTPLELPAGEHALPAAVVEAPCADLRVVVGVGAAALTSESALRRAFGAGGASGPPPEGTRTLALPCGP